MPTFIILVTVLVYILRWLYTSKHFTAYPTAIWVIKVDPFRMQALIKTDSLLKNSEESSQKVTN